VDNPDAVEVDQEVAKRTLLIVGFEKDPVPVYSFKGEESLRRS
jgi:hypothetical protein